MEYGQCKSLLHYYRIHYDTWYTKQKLTTIQNNVQRFYLHQDMKFTIPNLLPHQMIAPGTIALLFKQLVQIFGIGRERTYLFGTHRPDLTPWHMLGMTSKPDWWDSVYSWTDATKRARLITALTNGHTSNDANNTKTEVRYARWNWDWANKCPVDTSGQLVPREDVLGTPPVNRSQDFVFGDYGI